MPDTPTTVLLAAAGAGWEADALRQLSAGAPAIVLLKRCVDLSDLLSTATTGQARVALVAHRLPGLDAGCIDLLHRSGVGVVVVGDPDELESGGDAHVRRLGIDHVVASSAIDSLNRVILSAGMDSGSLETGAGNGRPADPVSEVAATGRVVTVWGPTGAPGRTTVAVGLAAELAHRQRDTLLVDVDGYGGAVAQHLGVLDETSGLLGAARLANAGRLDRAALASLARRVNPALRILTGLPRADRWAEVREGAFEHVLALTRSLATFVVLDTGFNLEQDLNAPFGSVAPGRNAMTLAGLEHADEVVVVGSADPIGLARLARSLVELLETVPGCTLRIAINHARPALGWGEREVRAMIEGFVTPASVHFLPEDRAAADRAVVSGQSLVEVGDSSLRRSLADLTTALLGEPPRGARRVTRRRAGTTR